MALARCPRPHCGGSVVPVIDLDGARRACLSCGRELGQAGAAVPACALCGRRFGDVHHWLLLADGRLLCRNETRCRRRALQSGP